MAVYYRKRIKIGKNASIIHTERLNGLGWAAIICFPFLVTWWGIKWLGKGCAAAWKLCPSVWKSVLAALCAVLGFVQLFRQGGRLFCLTYFGLALLCALWAWAGFDRQKVSDSDTQ